MAWDPLSAESLKNKMLPGDRYIQRIKMELMHISQDSPPGIIVATDDSDITMVHVLIIGPADTPYEGGFFYLIVGFPQGYPFKPPKVKFMTTGGSTVRFNPNIYANGMICVNFLGTWSNSWSIGMTLTPLLISIQSLLGEKPYHNEPGYEKTEKHPGDVQRYNDIITHETLRVAVVGMLDNDYGLNIPAAIREAMESNFLQFFDKYESIIRDKSNIIGLMKDPFGEKRGYFQWKSILKRLESIHNRLNPTQQRGNKQKLES